MKALSEKQGSTDPIAAQTERSSVQTPTKIEELESLRGVAAVLIMLSHFPPWIDGVSFAIVKNGYLMVELFFVLSGFVIYRAYGTKLNAAADLLRFIWLRIGRLYPVHLLLLLAWVGIELAKYAAQHQFGISSPNTEPFRENNLSAFVQQLLLIQAIGPTGNATTFNNPAWSISVEFYTYVVFGLVVLAFSKRALPVIALLFAASSILLVSGSTFGFERLLRCFAGFFLGCLVGNSKKVLSPSVANILSLAIAVLLMLFLVYKPVKEYDFLVFVMTAGLIHSLVSEPNGLLNSVLKARFLTWLGAVSYSLYMSHKAVQWVANQVFRVLLHRPEIVVDGQSSPVLSSTEGAIAYVVTLAAIFAVSTLVYVFVERPFREKSRRFAFDLRK